MVGRGPSEKPIGEMFRKRGVEDRLHPLGVRKGQALVDTYHAMDLFVFASQTETQGLVLAEAMAAGVPVIAVDAPGTRELVRDGHNGFLIPVENERDFVRALERYTGLPEGEKKTLAENARKTAQRFSRETCSRKALEVYESLIGRELPGRKHENSPWDETRRRIKAEWELIRTKTRATGSVFGES